MLGWFWRSKSKPTQFEIWRQNMRDEPVLIVTLDDYQDVLTAMERLRLSETASGLTTVARLGNPRLGTENAFTVCTKQVVVVLDDPSGKPRSRIEDMPAVHYWVETVLPEQCEIENARYARSPRS
jgi:hypothetical protein